MKKVVFLMIVFIVLTGQIGGVYGEEKPPDIYSGTGVVIDSSTGEVLYQKNKDEEAFPASLTKLMTAILLEDHMSDGEWMTASKKATQQEVSNFVFNLKVGERMQKEEALKALLVISANDVAMMIAEHIGGNEVAFGGMMNTKAASLGMIHTHFVTPNGLHDPKHVTTASDLALLAKEVMKYPVIMEALGTEKTEVKTDQRQVSIRDRSLIFRNPLALGGKTGFTNEAHNTLIEYMKKDNKTVIAVVMKSSRLSEYQDIETIGNYGLDHMDVLRMFQKGEPIGDTTFYGENVEGALGNSYILTKRKGDEAVYTYAPVYNTWQAGQKVIEAGDVIGTFQIKKNGELQKEIPIVSVNEVTHSDPDPLPFPVWSQKVVRTTSPSIWWYVTAASLLLVGYGLLNWIKRRKQRKQIMMFSNDKYGA